MHHYTCYAPEGFVLDLEQYPFTPRHNTQAPSKILDNMYFFISLITIKSIESNHKSFPLHTDYLQRKVRDYKLYLKYLENIGLITISESYYPSNHSKTYNLHKCWHNKKGIVIHKITNLKMIERITPPDNHTNKYPYITKYFNSNLSFDVDLANQILDAAEDLKMDKTYYLDRLNTIVSGPHKFSVGTTGRLYTPLTNLKSELRKTLTYAGQKIFVEIDIKNSLPFILSYLLKGIISKDNKDIINKYINNINIIDVRQVDDVMLFHTLVASGELYDILSDKFNQIKGKTYTRKQSKKRFNAVINQAVRQKDSKEKAVLRELFPTIISLIDNLYHNRLPNVKGQPLPLILQSIESKFVLEVVSRRIVLDLPDMPYYTVHDAWMVPIEKVDQVVSIIKDQARQFFNADIGLKY